MSGCSGLKREQKSLRSVLPAEEDDDEDFIEGEEVETAEGTEMEASASGGKRIVRLRVNG